ncbi:MAG: ABC transporter permease [Anaerolineaceae bacterium]|mgnify:CR=1 FL=1|nr:ABC transporter permease [Anaerolineaceae bacterium]MDD4041979.1 ABC transporter permease [Anaerolineaceae bacterium]MDD4577444.1 ABC transporter permease [Anaerolineaceae bacterium]
MKLALRIAWRFLTSSKGQTILIILGIAIGVSVQVFIGSLIAGLQQSLLDTAIGRSSQITISPAERGERIADYELIVDDIKATEPEITAISPVADSSGFIIADDSTFPILMRGFQFETAEGIYKFNDAIIEGSLPSGDEVILGKEFVEEASLEPGDQVTVQTPWGDKRDLVVSGVFDLGVTNLNKNWALAEISLVQSIFEFGDEVTAIESQVADVFTADVISDRIATTLPDNLKVENWKVLNASLLSGLNGQSISSLMIQIFVLVSVILGIASVLAISVSQKSRQLGILKAMGIRDQVASLIFLLQGFILGIFGSIVGVVFGLGLSYAFTKFALNPDGTPVIDLYIDPQFILLSAFIALLSATLAALIPARSSSRLSPIEVIRNG